jgi:rhodanese-related sulfurtransferase
MQSIEATRITVDEVKERLDRGEQFTFVDSRNPTAWAEAEKKLPNAIRVPAEELEQHLDEIPKDRTVITYCT